MEIINSKRDSYSTSLENIDLSISNRYSLSKKDSYNKDTNTNKSKSNFTNLKQIEEN